MNNDLSDMLCFDIYLSSLNDKEYDSIKHLIKSSKQKIMPLKSWDIYSDFYHKKLAEGSQIHAINEFRKLAKKLKLKNDIDAIFKDHSFQALVVTDLNKRIVWVSDGFISMTGYDKKFAIKKTSDFLQGKDTSNETKSRIRKKIQLNKPFTEVIVNYKKDKTPYKCELKVFPLFNKETTHYIALEKEAI